MAEDGGGEQAHEEGLGAEGAAGELGVVLGGDKVWVALAAFVPDGRELQDLHDAVLWVVA